MTEPCRRGGGTLNHLPHMIRGPRHVRLPLLGFAITRVHLRASPQFFWLMGSLEGHMSLSAVGCKFGLAWSDGPRGFSGNKAPQWAETRSSVCLTLRSRTRTNL